MNCDELGARVDHWRLCPSSSHGVRKLLVAGSSVRARSLCRAVTVISSFHPHLSWPRELNSGLSLTHFVCFPHIKNKQFPGMNGKRISKRLILKFWQFWKFIIYFPWYLISLLLLNTLFNCILQDMSHHGDEDKENNHCCSHFPEDHQEKRTYIHNKWDCKPNFCCD